jgi:hypothetical protein
MGRKVLDTFEVEFEAVEFTEARKQMDDFFNGVDRNLDDWHNLIKGIIPDFIGGEQIDMIMALIDRATGATQPVGVEEGSNIVINNMTVQSDASNLEELRKDVERRTHGATGAI